MAIDFAGDLAAFFDPEEFGEAIHFNGLAGSAIWNRPSGELETPGGRWRVATNMFMVPVTFVTEPAEGDTIVVDRLAAAFTVLGEPSLNDDGTIWACEASPA